MRGNDLAYQFTLPGNDECLVFQRVPLPFFDQCRNFGIFEKEFIKPGDLREHLEVREVLRLKILIRPLRRIARASKALPQRLITRIPADHMYRIRLK